MCHWISAWTVDSGPCGRTRWRATAPAPTFLAAGTGNVLSTRKLVLADLDEGVHLVQVLALNQCIMNQIPLCRYTCDEESHIYIIYTDTPKVNRHRKLAADRHVKGPNLR